MKRLQPQVRYKLVVPKIDGKIIYTSFPLKIYNDSTPIGETKRRPAPETNDYLIYLKSQKDEF